MAAHQGLTAQCCKPQGKTSGVRRDQTRDGNMWHRSRKRAYNSGVWGSTAETRQARVSLHHFFRGRGRPPWPHKHPLGLATLGHMTKRVTFGLCCGVHPPTVPVFVWFQVLALTHSSSSGGGQSTNCVLWLSKPQDPPPLLCALPAGKSSGCLCIEGGTLTRNPCKYCENITSHL